MLQGWLIVLTSFAYLGVLFGIAYFGDKRSDMGRSVIAHPTIYALSLAVYCTSWTFYGSVGRAASSGIGFLPVYLGPTLMLALWGFVMLKIIRISKTLRLTSIADFVAARYGKSQMIAGLVTVIAVVGVVPYIALQLKAVSTSFTLLLQYPEVVMPKLAAEAPILQDTALWTAMILAAFTVLFGTRHLDATERHEGMVAAIAFESLVKLVAFLAVGAFVTWGIYDGFADIFSRAALVPELQKLMVFNHSAAGYGSWASLTVLSMFSIMFLPRQFQIAVVENVNEKHLSKAIWMFPLYLLLINVFVLPIALGGLMLFPAGTVNADTFVLTLPMARQNEALALLVYIGGLSAATGMVIVETIALSTMVCNDMVMPILIRTGWLGVTAQRDVSHVLLGIRRWAIVAIVGLGYIYYRAAGDAYALVGIGLISFAAVAQFAPVIFGALYWRFGTRRGAMAALLAGFGVWIYTLLLPSFAKSGWMPVSFVQDGLFGLAWLRPQQLFGLAGMDEITHSLFWSLLANTGAYIGFSLTARTSAAEAGQANLFVNIFTQSRQNPASLFWRGSASTDELVGLIGRFLGPKRAETLLAAYARRRGVGGLKEVPADADFVQYAETLLAGAIGTASARVMVASVVKEEPLGLDEVMNILDEASQVRSYSRALERKSRELEAATTELRAANEQLKQLDRMKDDFVSTVTHELRTPLTSIRAFSELLRDNPDLDLAERERFLDIVVHESERLTRLINQVLDFAKMESGQIDWDTESIDLADVLRAAMATTSQLFETRKVSIRTEIPEAGPTVLADRDRLMQVMINLLSNAVKFVDEGRGHVDVSLRLDAGQALVAVRDNGPGIGPEEQDLIFEKFRQGGNTMTSKPQGTGLGLPISRQIVEHFGGRLWVVSAPGAGATFSFTLPVEGNGSAENNNADYQRR